MRKTSIVLLMGILLFSLANVSALGFDNTKDYDESTRTVTITNAFGLGDTIAELQLKTEPIVYVPAGEDKKVAEIEFKQFDKTYSNPLSKIELYDKNNGEKRFTRSFTYKKRVLKGYQDIPQYDPQCDEKAQNCKNVYIGNLKEPIYEWIKINGLADLTEGDVIGIFTNVYSGDYIEWIPTFFDKDIPEWAIWSETMHDGLVSYWTFDELSGNAIDKKGINDARGLGNITKGATTIINYSWALNGTGGNDRVINLSTTNANYDSVANFSVSFWYNYTAGSYLIYRGEDVSPNNCPLVFGSGDVVSGGPGGASVVSATSCLQSGIVHHMVITRNDSTLTVYCNGTRIGNSSVGTGDADDFGNNSILLGNRFDYGSGTTVAFDEFGWWNRTLTATEVSYLWNNGAGLPYASGMNVSVTLDYPIDNYATISRNVNFSAIAEINTGELTNATLLVYNATGVINNTLTNGMIGLLNNTGNFTIRNLGIGQYNWSVLACRNSTINCGVSANRTITISPLVENSQSFNSSTFETTLEGFTINISSINAVTGSLIYNGTSYAGTTTTSGTQNIISKSIDIPTVPFDNVSFYWQLYSNGEYYNSSWKNQTVNITAFGFCNTSLTTTYINFTFRDEATDEARTALVDSSTWTYWLGSGSVTKTLLFSNATKANPSYSFCLTPSRTMTTDLQFKYSNTSYPQRTFTYDNQDLTSTVTNKILYMLGSADGIYSSIQVLNLGGSPISGASVVMQRQFSGVWTIVEQGTTDSSGLVTFWVNPNYDHLLSVSKTGYISETFTIRPTQSVYTVKLTSTSGNATFASDVDGLRWVVYPGSGTLTLGSHNFNLTLTSYASKILENCKLELLNATNISQVLSSSSSVATNSTYCYTGFDYIVGKGDIFGRVSIDTDGTSGYVIVDSDSFWIFWDLNTTSGNWRPWNQVSSFFSELTTLTEFGDDTTTRDFSRLVFFFLIVTILIGVFTYFTGYEMTSPGMGIIIILGIIGIASAGGFLTLESGSGIKPILAKWGFFWMFAMISIGYAFDIIRRNR